MKAALVGSSGYIAEYILKSFEEEEEIESVLKLDRTDVADAYIDLAEPEKFSYIINY